MNDEDQLQSQNSETPPKTPKSPRVLPESLQYHQNFSNITRNPEPQYHPHKPPELHKHTRTSKIPQNRLASMAQ